SASTSPVAGLMVWKVSVVRASTVAPLMNGRVGRVTEAARSCQYVAFLSVISSSPCGELEVEYEVWACRPRHADVHDIVHGFFLVVLQRIAVVDVAFDHTDG